MLESWVPVQCLKKHPPCQVLVCLPALFPHEVPSLSSLNPINQNPSPEPKSIPMTEMPEREPTPMMGRDNKKIIGEPCVMRKSEPGPRTQNPQTTPETDRKENEKHPNPKTEPGPGPGPRKPIHTPTSIPPIHPSIHPSMNRQTGYGAMKKKTKTTSHDPWFEEKDEMQSPPMKTTMRKTKAKTKHQTKPNPSPTPIHDKNNDARYAVASWGKSIPAAPPPPEMTDNAVIVQNSDKIFNRSRNFFCVDVARRRVKMNASMGGCHSSFGARARKKRR
ncbi:hypothetical protein VTJ04DRAFT_6857 [Mycothermus thermophilus]|uniref:uncharacterized protein n=1 Tax=Humicola insolens TaxID=85995 RepID=UPI00374328FD